MLLGQSEMNAGSRRHRFPFPPRYPTAGQTGRLSQFDVHKTPQFALHYAARHGEFLNTFLGAFHTYSAHPNVFVVGYEPDNQSERRKKINVTWPMVSHKNKLFNNRQVFGELEICHFLSGRTMLSAIESVKVLY